MPNPLHTLNTLPQDVVRTLATKTAPIVIGSPAYDLPELKSDADAFAENMMRETPHLTELERLALAWLSGRTNGLAKGRAR